MTNIFKKTQCAENRLMIKCDNVKSFNETKNYFESYKLVEYPFTMILAGGGLIYIEVTSEEKLLALLRFSGYRGIVRNWSPTSICGDLAWMLDSDLH